MLFCLLNIICSPMPSLPAISSGHNRDRVVALRHLVESGGKSVHRSEGSHLPLGLFEVDQHLPGAGLACGALHEISAATYGDTPSAFGFAVALAALARRLRTGPALLVSPRRSFADFGQPYGHGLCQLGLDPGNVILVETRGDKDALWAMEEALRSKAAALVVGVAGSDQNLTSSRRLSLAAAASDMPLVLLRAHRAIGASAAQTRWRIAPAPAAKDRFGALALPRWRVALERCRNGRTGQWQLEWDHAACRFRLAEELADRAPVADAGRMRRAG